jgi:hypothetical protein
MTWLQANRAKQQVDPLVRGELTAAISVLFEIEGRCKPSALVGQNELIA